MRAGQRIGKYVLDERIAVGGMAEVWAARMEGPQGFTKPLALKFILESFAGDPELERLFVNEARIAARLQHANLVTVFDFDKIGADQEPGLAGRYYIAMERVEGQDLRRIAQAAQRAGFQFPVGVALHLAGEALKALRYVHERRDSGHALDLVHRDVSPHNVLVGYSGEVKVSDFGIAKSRAHSARGTKTGTVRGKVAYASPEQLSGQPVDHRTNQFALGVTLWEILAGRRLFDGRDNLETIGQVVRCAVPRLGELPHAHDVPAPVEAVVRRMLSSRPADRFAATADALAAVLGLHDYLADGTALGDLVRTLFLPSHVEIPATMPIQAMPEAARAAATRTMQQAAAPAPAPAPSRATPATAREAAVAGRHGSTDTPPTVPASAHPPEQRGAPRAAAARIRVGRAAAGPRAPRGQTRTVLIVGGLAAAVVGAGVLGAWLLSSPERPASAALSAPETETGIAARDVARGVDESRTMSTTTAPPPGEAARSFPAPPTRLLRDLFPGATPSPLPAASGGAPKLPIEPAAPAALPVTPGAPGAPAPTGAAASPRSRANGAPILE